MTQAISCQAITLDAQVQSLISLHLIYGRKSGTITRFSLIISVLLCQYHRCSIHIYILMLIISEPQVNEAWEPSN